MKFSNDPGYYVAHYTRPDTAVDHILKKRTLRIGPLLATNDPKETKMWNFGISSSRSSTSPSSKELEKLAHQNYDFNKILRNGFKVLCVSQDTEKAIKMDFSERAYCKPRMWAQYAENHRGVCLIFDKQVLHKTLEHKFGRESLYFGNVSYDNFHDVRSANWTKYMDAFLLSGDDIKKDGLEITLENHRDKYLEVFFFWKNKDWEHETEYRWIIRARNNEPEFIQIEDSLRAILLGVDFPVERLSEIHEYCKNTNTTFSRIVWRNGMPIVQWFEPNNLDSPEYYMALNHYTLLNNG